MRAAVTASATRLTAESSSTWTFRLRGGRLLAGRTRPAPTARGSRRRRRRRPGRSASSVGSLLEPRRAMKPASSTSPLPTAETASTCGALRPEALRLARSPRRRAKQPHSFVISTLRAPARRCARAAYGEVLSLVELLADERLRLASGSARRGTAPPPGRAAAARPPSRARSAPGAGELADQLAVEVVVDAARQRCRRGRRSSAPLER